MKPSEAKQKSDATVVSLTPKLDERTQEFVSFCRKVICDVDKAHPGSTSETLAKYRSELIPEDTVSEGELSLIFSKSVILDLLSHRWELWVDDSLVYGRAPTNDDGSNHGSKHNVRASHLLGRDAQLREKSVRAFVQGMERRRLTDKGWHSIHSVMRDGANLATELHRIRNIENQTEKLDALKATISPYIQFVETNALCTETGLRVSDIWRYFRHTWVNEYRSTPGRSMALLIRDAGAQNHPVIGIAALGSSVVQNRLRDEWIGWHSKSLVDEIALKPKKKVVGWLLDSLNRLISDIYVKDLEEEGIISEQLLTRPTYEVVERLAYESERAIVSHRKEPQKTKHEGQRLTGTDSSFWENEARTSLYRSKRCKQLSKLLGIRRQFLAKGVSLGVRSSKLKELFASTSVKNASAQLIRMVKAEHVGIKMMDITVCGAIAPYNALLGGKLVCMLLCSPEVTEHYSKRYSGQVSVIASAMKGRAVTRKPNLVLLCTTSLYGVGSSQYNRVKVPLREIGLPSDESIAYKNLGHSFGYGTYHFSRGTIELGSTLNSRKKDGRRVNSIFGEGVNPLMRKLRESIDQVGLSSEDLLQHGNQRVTYGVRLASNFREVLLGMQQRPRYLIPKHLGRDSSRRLSHYWLRRWLSGRIDRVDVLDQVAKHSIVFPIKHGAAVPLPDDLDESLPFEP